MGHGNGHAGIGVFKPHNEGVGTVIHGQKAGLPLPEVFFCDSTIYFFGNAASQGIVEIFDQGVVGQGGFEQFSARGVIIGGDLGTVGFCGQETVQVVRVDRRAGG